MAKLTDKQALAVVRKILTRIEEKTRDRPKPAWIAVSALELTESWDVIDAVTAFAASKNWLSVGGDPAHSVAITADGRALLSRPQARRKS